MRIPIVLGLYAPLMFSQTKPFVGQAAGSCAVNIAGNGNTASLVCNGLDPKLAEQMRAILNGTRRNESAAKEISAKLDLILKQIDKEAIPPDVALRFVYPESPALVGVNRSGAIARDIQWAVALWNMDLPDRNDPLPIPTSSFKWLRPNDESGPIDLFNGPLVAPLLKTGDRLFGSATVACAECARGRTYIVYIVWGESGWVSEVDNEKSGKLIAPPNFLKAPRIEFFKALDTAVPAVSRQPILSDR